MAVKTQGTQLYIIDPEPSAGCEILTVLCATSLSGLGAPREQIETTCLEDDARTYVGGLATPGQLTVTLNFDPNNESHYRMYELWRDNVDFTFAIGVGSDIGTPTLDSNCDFEFPTTRAFLTAQGYVVDLPLEFALNQVVTASVPIQVSGEYLIVRKVA